MLSPTATFRPASSSWSPLAAAAPARTQAETSAPPVWDRLESATPVLLDTMPRFRSHLISLDSPAGPESSASLPSTGAAELRQAQKQAQEILQVQESIQGYLFAGASAHR